MRFPLENKAAYIDLSRNKIVTQDISRDLRKRFLGGRGLNIYFLYNLLEKNIDPISPDNILVIGVGLLAGVPCLGSGRFSIMAKSPLTNALGDSNIGEHFGVKMRRNGIDHLIIKGRAEKPSIILIDDGKITIEDATDFWGLDVYETFTALEDKYGKDIESLVIGPAGEKLVRFASLRSRVKGTAARTGMGCVMGSKMIKAIVVRGGEPLTWKNNKEMYKYCRELNDRIAGTKWGKALNKYGTPIMMIRTYPMGLLRFKNMKTNYLEGFETLHPDNMEKYEYGQSGCYGCIIRCRKRYRLNNGKYPHNGEGPDYGHIGAFGFTIANNNLEVVLQALYLTNKYGLDSMEVGSIVAWITELYENGLIDENTLDGLKPEWGSEEFLYEMINRITFRVGIGDVLAEGISRASKKLGPQTIYYAVQTKGQSWILSDDRPVPSFSLGMSVSTRGADHLRSRPALDLYGLPKELLRELYGGEISNDFRSYEGKHIMIHWHELEYAVVDSLGLCKFQTRFISVNAPTFEEWSKLIKLATGLEFTIDELFTIGERIYTLERMFNVREGFTRKDDYPPERMFREGTNAENVTVEKGTKLDREKYNELLTKYYERHGWDENGIPKKETLSKLGLKWEKELDWDNIFTQ